jgi:hypothetical protein
MEGTASEMHSALMCATRQKPAKRGRLLEQYSAQIGCAQLVLAAMYTTSAEAYFVSTAYLLNRPCSGHSGLGMTT